MRAFVANLLLALLLAAVGASGSDIEPQLFKKGHFAETRVLTFPNIALKCYLVTSSNIEIDILDENLSDKYEYVNNTFSSCGVKIKDLNKSDEGLWSLHAVLPSEGGTVYESKVQMNILIIGTDISESVSSEESSKQSAEDTVTSDESSKQSAEDTVTSQESSKQSAEDTVDSEESSKQSAEDIVASVETSKQSAEDQVPSEESSKQSAEDTVASEESSKQSAEDTVAFEESSKQSAEDTITSEESSKHSAEDTVASEESSKQSAEDTVASEESSKQSVEDTVTSEESVKQSAEDTVDSEESSKQSAEDTVASEETSKQSAEDKVPSEESSKQSAEDTVASEESSKQSAEDTATSEESSKHSAEDTVTSEESSKQTAEDTVTSEESSKQSAEDTVASEESSKQSAEDTVASEEIPEEDNNVSIEHPATSLETESLEASSSEEEQAVETQWLSDLQFITRTELNVDINLPRTLNTEKCTLTKPDGTTMEINSDIPGVTVHSTSDYVSCRVVVGPMEESLLGKWTLCGSYEENNVEHRRCQNAEIVWRSTSNPGSMWQTRINPKFDHVVHFGSTLIPTVQGSGSVVSCHVVTPDEEDLYVNRNREYPNVRLVQDTVSTCSIAIGPIAESHLGDWTVYGTFGSVLSGYNEVRLPFNMELYDKDDPYAQAYNVTTLNPTQHVVNLGSTIPVEVTSTGAIDVCQFTTPSGQTYHSTGTMPTGVSFVNSNRVACQLSIGPMTEDMLGNWQLVGKFSNRNVYTERRLTFEIIQEDPRNPIEEDRTVQYLDQNFYDTAIGASHRVVISSDILSTFQSCHIRTPEGLQYTIMEGFHIPGVEVETESNVFCGVTLQVSEELIGNWTLVSREIRSSQAIERRRPFVIYVEETVEAVPNEITITEGNSMHVRLANPTDLNDTCELHDPNDQEAGRRQDDNQETCGFVVSSVDAVHSGTWNIVYGTKIIYKAPVRVSVNARGQAFVQSLTWVEHTSVSQIVGPEEAVYCRVLSPMKNVVFDGFGRCHVAVDRVIKDQHEATWTMDVGLPGRIVTEKYQFDVKVIAADQKPQVSSSVSTSKSTVELTCSVTSSRQKTGCVFRNPAGESLVASQGVSEDRYVFHVNQTSIDADSYYYSCSLQITDPATSELGLWRCDLESEEENYYGFLSVLLPWAMQDPAVSALVVAEPALTAAVTSVTVEEGEPATLACSARAPLRYCYFRAPNGTIFNLQPGISAPGMEYTGAGLDAGECGVRINSLMSSDSGTWSCHAGVNGLEQLHRISVFAQELFQLSASRERRVLKGQVAGFRPVEYCRFVRSDGLGFTSNNAPYPYVDESVLSQGYCRIQMMSNLDWQPWTVVTKIQGRDGEISRVTGLSWSTPTPVYYNKFHMWLPLLMIMIGCFMVAALAPARNRRWAAERASSMRDSMRASMRRFPSLRKNLTDTKPAA